jgi:hypothetical protein
MTTNNKISNLINTQVPFFVRNDHQNFVRFLEAYYEWTEQSNNVVTMAKSLPTNLDVDRSIDLFIQHFYDTYIKDIPKAAIADKTLILKHVKDFYRARGTEKSIEFLLRILFGEEGVEFYYPKQDILRTSDGKWFIEKALKIADVKVNGVANDDILIVQNFLAKKVSGNTSNATAIVEKVDTYYEFGTLVNELKISAQYKSFAGGETLFTMFDENGVTKSLTATLFSGALNSVIITDPGVGYSVGDSVVVESNTGSGALVVVSAVTAGTLEFVSVRGGGAGFQVNNALLFSGGGGSGANGFIDLVQDDNFYHPNSYNIAVSTISLEANTLLSNALYSNINSSNANVALANALSFFRYANTGPISSVFITSNGTSYFAAPDISVVANTRVQELGILGRMEIVTGGQGYQANDQIVFYNQPGSYGQGALGNVISVNATGGITGVKFVLGQAGMLIGGQGYRQDILPIANVISANAQAFGANIAVTAVLGSGEDLIVSTGTIGAISEIQILNRGSSYAVPPTINLTASGDGTAQAYSTIITGTFSYPGRYLNDDGHLSGYNFLEDRDYYQNFSYVVKAKQSIEKYRKALKDLIHPMGMKLFGEYMFFDEYSLTTDVEFMETNITSFKHGNYYVSNTTNVKIQYAGHTATANANIGIEFLTGNVVNSNGVYTCQGVVNSSIFFIGANTGLGSGNNGTMMFTIVV